VNVASHTAGLVVALLFLRAGTPSVPLADRPAYLAARPAGWVLGWGVWAVCALAALWFLTLLAERLPSVATRMGAAVVVAAVAVDLTCDGLYTAVLPELARRSPGDVFLVAERAIGVASLLVANGLYSMAALLAAQAGPTPPARLLGTATALCGFGLAAAGALASPRGIEAWTGPTVVLFMAWTVVVARAVEGPPAR
jgi:hypothetical protein